MCFFFLSQIEIIKNKITKCIFQETGTEFEAKITPSSHSSTLRRKSETKTQTQTKSTQQQLLQPPIYDSIATKPTQSIAGTVTSGMLGNNQTKTILSSATNPFSMFDRNAADYRHINSHHETNFSTQNYHTLTKAPLSSSSSLSSNNHQLQQKHSLDFRQQSNGTRIANEYDTDARIVNHSNHLNLSNSSIANQLLPNMSGGSGIGTLRLNSATFTTPNSSINKELNRNHHTNNRNHIITDTLPGPESCV